jgi:hypothetical protein
VKALEEGRTACSRRFQYIVARVHKVCRDLRLYVAHGGTSFPPGRKKTASPRVGALKEHPRAGAVRYLFRPLDQDDSAAHSARQGGLSWGVPPRFCADERIPRTNVATPSAGAKTWVHPVVGLAYKRMGELMSHVSTRRRARRLTTIKTTTTTTAVDGRGRNGGNAHTKLTVIYAYGWSTGN